MTKLIAAAALLLVPQDGRNNRSRAGLQQRQTGHQSWSRDHSRTASCCASSDSFGNGCKLTLIFVNAESSFCHLSANVE